MKKLIIAAVIMAALSGCASKVNYLNCDLSTVNFKSDQTISTTSRGAMVVTVAGVDAFSYSIDGHRYFQSPDLVNGKARAGGKMYARRDSRTFAVNETGSDLALVMTNCKKYAGL